MNRKMLTLIVVLAIFMGASGYLWYRMSQGTSFTLMPTVISSQDVIVRDQVNKLYTRFSKFLLKFKSQAPLTSDLDTLVNSDQFKELDASPLRQYTVTPYVPRSNPFEPVDYGESPKERRP